LRFQSQTHFCEEGKMSALQDLGRKLGLQEGQSNELLKEVLAMVQGKNGAGLQELVQKFQQQGLGDAVSSWVGTGQNQAITSEQIQKVLGEKLAQWASQLKLPKEAIGAQLAKLLPVLIDRLTPHGKVPDAAQVETEVDKYLGS
jgi:uncharacterized protein YidB (DUF937 family)